MGFIIIAPFAILSGWSIFAICRWLKQGGYLPKWQKQFALLLCVGAVAGVGLAFFLRYNVANKRISGFPIPLEISSREKPDASWTEAPMPVPIRIGGMVTDFLCGVALCLAPLAVAAFFQENRTNRDGQSDPRTNAPS